MDQESTASARLFNGSTPDPDVLAVTRRQLHGIGECLMAGPQRRAGGRFTLRVTPGGFATTGEPALRLDGTDLVVDESRRVPVTGTFANMAGALGVEFGPPPDPYPDGSGVGPSDDIAFDSGSAQVITDWYLVADAALRVMAPRETPILWPEHFDVAILLDNTAYGALAGDGFQALPYAYVSSSRMNSAADNVSDFWNAPFGAARSLPEMSSLDDLVTFWRAGQALLDSPN
jgi:hypothetical protein